MASSHFHIPSSLNTGVQRMRDFHAPFDVERRSAHTLRDSTPYLGLRARLSQVWLNRWTVLLLLVLARTLLAITGLHNDLASAQTEALSACSAVESMGSAMASMPYYLSTGVNDLAAHGVEQAVYALMSGLMLVVTGVEEMVVFYINMLTQVYVCLITFAVSGSLHVALQVAKDVSTFLNTTLKSISSDLTSDVNKFQSDFNGFLNEINSIPQFLGGSAGKAPTIDLNGTISQLQNIQLPSGLDEGLTKINNSIPTFAQVNNFTNDAIRLPFEDIKTLLNNSIDAFTFDSSVFPVPAKQQLTFCTGDSAIQDFFNGLQDIVSVASKIFIAVLVLGATLACFPMAYREIRGWRTMQQRAKLVVEKSGDPLDVVYIVSRPYTATAGLALSRRFQAPRNRNLVRWLVAYTTTPAALFILSLALAGLFSCLCQYILLQAIEKEVPALVNEVEGFADKVIASLEAASADWSNGTNTVILTENQKINNDIFGWVNISTTALNNTLNVFVDDMSTALNQTFGGTVLYQPITDVLYCLIGLKIAGIEKGLAWVQDHAHVDFPLFPNNTFSAGAALSIANNNTNASDSFLASPGSEATDKISNAIVTVTTHLGDAIRTEAIISTVVLMLWVLLVFMGLCRILFLAAKRDMVRGEGGHTYAGDIPMEQRPVQSMISPSDNNLPHSTTQAASNDLPQDEAPPYEAHAKPSSSRGGRLAAFQEPMRTGGKGSSHGSDELDYQDRKLGFAGEREVVENRGHARGSSYAQVEDGKGHF